jgi:type III secretion system YscQ/HrcQ family protein
VVASAIKRPSATVTDPSSNASAGLAGALAAVIVAIARRTHGGDVVRVLAAGSSESLEADLRGARGDDTASNEPDPWRALTLTVRVDDDAFAARLVVCHEQALVAPDPPWTRQVLSRLGPTPLSIPIVACQARCTVAECAELRTGDVLLPEAWPLGRGKNGGLAGPVLLAAPGSDAVGVRAVLSDDGRLVLSGEVEPLAAAEARMAESDESEGGALLAAIGDVPVIVRVELGEARMAARDWASLGRGDVVTLGRRVGEQVVLRVGGIPVARGQLVEVDGHVGVRIDERISEERTTA